MPIGKNIPAFQADFKCLCGSVIGVKIATAIVESQTGAEVECRKCKQLFKVTPKGAWPISGESEVTPAVMPADEAPAFRVPTTRAPAYSWALRMPSERRKD